MTIIERAYPGPNQKCTACKRPLSTAIPAVYLSETPGLGSLTDDGVYHARCSGQAINAAIGAEYGIDAPATITGAGYRSDAPHHA